ncbi:MAG: antibiotic biosynthesis monooxygenase [Candidatus Thioglobus sp.]|nr:MAG: antibiotic biosynthesis monooxygenase [Candidatus Thioglobus sp.]|tara:strand:+ start:171 stop:479 length:309 start_codon:yes stop_codon:yes gene_type:complete
MHVVTNRVFVHPDWQQTFETRFEQRAGQIESQPGFKRMQILKPHSDQAPYVVYTEWQSEAAFKQWLGSDDFKAAHQNPMPDEAFTQQGMLEQHTVIISADVS